MNDKLSLLELAPAELAVPLKVTQAGRVYRLRHILRPPRAADWCAYEAALRPEVEELPGPDNGDDVSYRLQVRTSDAALLLWARLALRVEGYSLPEAEGNAAWRALIPLTHKEAAVRALTLVAPAAASPLDTPNDGGFALGAGEVAVELECVSSGAAYPRLAHFFRPPTVEAERAYRRLLAETLIVRGGRAPRTILPARLPALVRLYDELIVRVEGYSINLEPPGPRAQLLEHMDAWHKRVAVQTLFGDLTPETPQPAAASEVTEDVP